MKNYFRVFCTLIVFAIHSVYIRMLLNNEILQKINSWRLAGEINRIGRREWESIPTFFEIYAYLYRYIEFFRISLDFIGLFTIILIP